LFIASATGGTWSSSNASVASIDGMGNVTAVTAGNAVISYALTNSCGAATVTYPITVSIAPTNAGTISGVDSICIRDTARFTSSVAGGTWSSFDRAIAVVDSTGRVAGIARGFSTITYTVTNACGSVFTTYPVYVNSATECNTGLANVGQPVAGMVWYPNPNNGTFVVDLPQTALNVSIMVTDAAGRVLLEINPKNACGTKVPVQLRNAASGTYTLKVSVDGVLHYDKITVW